MVDLLLSFEEAEGIEWIFYGRGLYDTLLAVSAGAHEAAGHGLAEVELLGEEGVVVAVVVLLYRAFADVL